MALGGLGWLLASYLFAAGMIRQDVLRYRTLAIVGAPIAALRHLGHAQEWLLQRQLPTPADLGLRTPFDGPLPQLLGAALIVLAVFSPALIAGRRPKTWSRSPAPLLSVLALAAAFVCSAQGKPWFAAGAGLLAGIGLLASGRGRTPGNPHPLLALIPVGLAVMLRFYALAQVPNGYAEHAAILHAKLSLPYYEALTSSIAGFSPQPFLSTASDALLHEQSGLLALLSAVGFRVLGISLTTTRVLSGLLGTLTIWVAYQLGRELGGVRLGLVFSFILAAAPWHITISRYSTAEHVLAPLQLLLALLFLVRAVQKGGVWDVALAAFFLSLTWYVYASNLTLPLIAAAFVVYKAVAGRQGLTHNWRKIMLGVGIFAALSIAPIANEFPQGILQPNLRTGYGSAGPLWTDWPKRLTMLQLESSQLFRRADDPWFATQTPGLGIMQSAFFVPALVLAIAGLRRSDSRDLSVLLLLAIPLGAMPAVFAPDPSFRRLMVVATFAALGSALVLVRLLDLSRTWGLSPRAWLCMVGIAGLLLASAGTFGYFDRTSTGEETRNAWFQGLGQTVSNSVGRQPLVVVIPHAGEEDDANRYIRLMAYDVIADAESRGIQQGTLYHIVTCDTPRNEIAQTASGIQPPQLIIASTALDAGENHCGRDVLAVLKARYPDSGVVVSSPNSLPADLEPAGP